MFAYDPLTLAALVLGLVLLLTALVLFVRGARRAVTIARPTLEALPIAPTLARERRPETLAVPVAVPVPTPPPPPPSVAASVGVPVDASAEPDGDDLLRLKGVGPKLAARLRELGVTRFGEIAGWDDAALARIDAQLGSFAGRPERDRWVEQARLLADGDEAGFAERFGRLGQG